MVPSFSNREEKRSCGFKRKSCSKALSQMPYKLVAPPLRNAKGISIPKLSGVMDIIG
jgi:hypothetical protein